MKTQAENPNGLHLRYIVQKANGEPVDLRAEYFILRTDKFASDQRHAAACRRALITYATEIAEFLPQLAAELLAKHGHDVPQSIAALRELVDAEKKHVDEGDQMTGERLRNAVDEGDRILALAAPSNAAMSHERSELAP